MSIRVNFLNYPFRSLIRTVNFIREKRVKMIFLVFLIASTLAERKNCVVKNGFETCLNIYNDKNFTDEWNGVLDIRLSSIDKPILKLDKELIFILNYRLVVKLFRFTYLIRDYETLK